MSNTKKVLILLAFILSFGLQIKAQPEDRKSNHLIRRKPTNI